MATVSGTVKDSTGAFASRIVRAYRRSDGAFAGQTVSNATTGTYSITALDGTPHFAVVHDGAAADGDLYWNNVVLAMHMDDAGLTDVKGHAVTLNGNAARSATQSKFGGYSVYLDGSGDYLTIPNSVDWSFDTGDFTIEGWLYLNTVTGYQNIFSTNSGAVPGLQIYTDTTSIGVHCYNGTTTYYATGTVTASAWIHIAAVRNGTSLRLFINGTSGANTVLPAGFTQNNPGSLVVIGRNPINSSWYPNAYIDDLRITKGVARYTADFTPPTQAFPDTALVPGTPAENALIFDNITPV